jgi:hypothetical protein
VDGQGHPIPTAIGTVQLSITEGTPQSGRGSLGCTSGTTLALVSGVVRFSGCSITGAGRGYQLSARLLDGAGGVGEVGGLDGFSGPADTSLPFDIASPRRWGSPRSRSGRSWVAPRPLRRPGRPGW